MVDNISSFYKSNMPVTLTFVQFIFMTAYMIMNTVVQR
jgi:hypothetical protein